MPLKHWSDSMAMIAIQKDFLRALFSKSSWIAVSHLCTLKRWWLGGIAALRFLRCLVVEHAMQLDRLQTDRKTQKGLWSAFGRREIVIAWWQHIEAHRNASLSEHCSHSGPWERRNNQVRGHRGPLMSIVASWFLCLAHHPFDAQGDNIFCRFGTHRWDLSHQIHQIQTMETHFKQVWKFWTFGDKFEHGKGFIC